MAPVASLLPCGMRLHLQHGPIDLVIGADGEREAAFAAATARFETVLEELVAELPLLRSPLEAGSPLPEGGIARLMDRAARPHCGEFLTRMAAVAGAVADTILAAMRRAAWLRRAYVNNGGDIAMYLAQGQSFATAMADHHGRSLGRIDIGAGDGIGGIASSGRHGRSLSMGIADNVTVLASCAAGADAAATLIANAVDLPGHPAIRRVRADSLQPDSDLGHRKVVTDCAALPAKDVAAALDAGHCRAAAMLRDGHILGAALFLQGETRLAGHAAFTPIQEKLLHA